MLPRFTLGAQLFVYLPDCISDISNDLSTWTVDIIDNGGCKGNVENLTSSARKHDNGWFFGLIVANHNYQVTHVERSMHEIIVGKSRTPKKSLGTLIQYTLSHLGGCPVNSSFRHKGAKCGNGALTIGGGTHNHNGTLCCHEQLNGTSDRLLFRNGTTQGELFKDSFGSELGSNIFRKFNMNRSWLFGNATGKGSSDGCRQHVSTCDTLCKFRQWFHHFHHVDDLKVCLLTFLDWFLSSQKEAWKASQKRKGGACCEIGGARAQSGERHPRLTR
mmetsp:Transcript_31260/g.56646  ORF Transcript_31260/g.56646 Transcript_31260/m.56646 type:complete len:274 (+) Transcript_31260:2414-3235(+)